MKSKTEKILKIGAVSLFLFALFLNVKTTLDDPFIGISETAIATGTGSTGDSGSNPGNIWIPIVNTKTIGTPTTTTTSVGCPEGQTKNLVTTEYKETTTCMSGGTKECSAGTRTYSLTITGNCS